MLVGDYKNKMQIYFGAKITSLVKKGGDIHTYSLILMGLPTQGKNYLTKLNVESQGEKRSNF